MIESSPSAAVVVIKTAVGKQVFTGTTPATAVVSKSDQYVVTISLEGYKAVEVSISKDGIEGWFWGNILIGGIIGMVVDSITGAYANFEPDTITITLEQAVSADKGGEMQIMAVLSAFDTQGKLRSMAVPMERE